MKRFMVEMFHEDESGCCFEQTDERLFESEGAARAFFEWIDPQRVWETEYRTSGFTNRKTVAATIQAVEVDEDGEIENYGEIIGRKSYGWEDRKAADQDSIDIWND